MPWNGSGSFVRTKSWVADRDADIEILATRHDENDDEFEAGINAAITRNGEAKPTADLSPNSDSTLSIGTNALRWVRAWISESIKFRSSTYVTTLTAVAGTAERTIYLADADYTIWPMPVGVIFPYTSATAPSGWVLCNGLTIGDASSSATGRAHADTSTLFTHLWTNFADAQAAVSSGRGASAAADFAAHKTIALPDMRGRSIFGMDTMGTSAAGRVTSGSSGVDAATLGAVGGNQLMHQHTHGVSDPGHNHQQGQSINADQAGVTACNFLGSDTQNTTTETTGITINNSGSGSSQNMPPAIVLTAIIKL